MEITEKKMKELGLSRSELLSIALFAQANEFIGNNKPEIVRCLRNSNKPLVGLKMIDIYNAINGKYGCYNLKDDVVVKHIIGNNSYEQKSSYAMKLYDRICKDEKIKQETIDIEKSVGGVKKNCKGLTTADYVSKDELRPVMMNIFMDDEAKVAVATDAHVLFVNPLEYVKIDTERPNGVKGHLVMPKDWTESECEDRYQNWEAVIPKDENLHDIVMRDNLKMLIASAESHLKSMFSGKGKNKHHAIIKITRPQDGEQVWMSTPVMKKILKAGTDGWKQESPLRAIKKTFEDGSIIIAMPCMKPDENDRHVEIVNDDIYINKIY